jgi:histidinol-phosphatase (PHP family)
MGFTDHVMLPWIEYYHSVRGKYSQSHEYLESIRALQEQYADEIYILLGYECEWNEIFEGYYRHLIDNNLVDYLIMGNHYLEFDTTTNRFDYFNGSMESIEFVQAYTESSIQGLESGLFSIFAHPDYVLYYAKMWNSQVEDYMRQMCVKAKELGVALEYNHGYVQYPQFWDVVKEVGNTVVIGLDAHDPSVYSSSKRSQSISFLNSKGIAFVEDLGITQKQPMQVTQTHEVTVTGGTGSGTYDIFDSVEITAQVGEGQIFDYWLINGEESNKPATFTLVVEEDTTVVAAYEEDTEIGYSYEFDYSAQKGDNVYGSLTWNASMASYGMETGSSNSRGMAFRIAEEASQTLVMKTTVTRYEISQITVEAAMGSGNDTTMSISVGGTEIVSDLAVTNHITPYTYDVGDLNGEIIITLKATETGKASYIKSVTLVPVE